MRVFPADNGNSSQYAKLNISDVIANNLHIHKEIRMCTSKIDV